MKQWSLVALALFTFAASAGCHTAASDTKGEEPIDRTSLTGATVSRIPITPPPRIDETATKAGADGAEEMSPEPFWTPPPLTTTRAGASGTLVSSKDQMVNPPPRSSASPGQSFPESTFGDDNALDAGAPLPVERDIPR